MTLATSPSQVLQTEVARRRTFAIISHPDAGKTTLTEKLLLYAGAIDLAGAVRARGSQRRATSDWMAMEQERGISVTASALEVEYKGYRINLLDTPGHQDFSEDTYRTLMAVDSAVMVLDSARGIEAQTLKLFQVCRMRHIPILTFINKMDHDGRDPLDLLDEIERVLGITPVPLNWPVGSGPWFQGVYDFRRDEVLRFERTEHNQRPAPVSVAGLEDPALDRMLGDVPAGDLREQSALLAGAGSEFDSGLFLTGMMTPVFFGSALNSFGVEPFLEALIELAPPPGAREALSGPIAPESEEFTGFVFKIQANMDMKHRDRMAFVRICSGRFEKDMVVSHPRLNRKLRLGRAYRLFARERESIDEAFPGDVIGVINPGQFAIGDTISLDGRVTFPDIPRFQPEHFATLLVRDISRYKQFHKGLLQLEEEGAVQVFHAIDASRQEPILGVVGALQFDVVAARLRDEYGVETRFEHLALTRARWLAGGDAALAKIRAGRGPLTCRDRHGQPVILFSSDWEIEYLQKLNPDVELIETS